MLLPNHPLPVLVDWGVLHTGTQETNFTRQPAASCPPPPQKTIKITPNPKGIGLSAPRSRDGGAAQGSPNPTHAAKATMQICAGCAPLMHHKRSTHQRKLNSESALKDPEGCISSTNAVSERFISAAMDCLCQRGGGAGGSAGMSRQSSHGTPGL